MTATDAFTTVLARDLGTVTLSGCVVIDASGDPQPLAGSGFLVEHTDDGEYTVTVYKSFPRAVACLPSVNAATPTLVHLTSSDGTVFAITCFRQDGTSKLFVPTDLDENEALFFVLTFLNPEGSP